VSLRTLHYSTRTGKSYVGWIRRFIVFHSKRHTVGVEELDDRIAPGALRVGQ
jgi:hypothetical protein